MKKFDSVIKVGIIYNAFDPTDITRNELVYRKNTKLKSYLKDLPTACDWAIGLNGKPIDLEKDGNIRLKPNDTIQLVVIPRGGGAKNILRMVAMVALVVAAAALTMGAGAPLAGATVFGMSAAASSALIMSAIVLTGGLLINAVLPPAKIKTDKEDSESYGYDGAKNTSKQGIAIPVVYGKYRVAGNYVDLYTQNTGDDQYLYGRTVLSDGKIFKVSEPLLNDQPINNYNGVSWGWKPGNDTHTVNPWFNRNISQVNKGIKLTDSAWTIHTTTEEVDQIQLNLQFPRGLVHFSKKGKKKYRTAGIQVQISVAGANDWYALGDSHWKQTTLVTDASETTTKLQLTTQPVIADTSVPTDYSYDVQYRKVGDTVWQTAKTITGTTANTAAYTPTATDYSDVTDGAVTYEYQPNEVTTEIDVDEGSYEARVLAAGGPFAGLNVFQYAKSGAPTGGIYTWTDNRAKVLRKTIESGKLPLAQYDIRIKRSTAEGDNERDVDELYLTDVGEIVTTSIPMNYVANAYYKIKMTEQLNSVPNITWLVEGVEVNHYDINGDVTQKAWSDNPAWIILDMLIGDERGSPQIFNIDFPLFVEWADYCDSQGLKFNGVFDTTQTLWDACQEVLRVGHAAFTRVGTKLSLTIDKPADPVMLFGPGNIFKDTFKITYIPMTGRANEFELNYYDVTDGNKQKTIRISDPDADNRGDMPRAVSYNMPGIDNFEQAQKEIWYQLYNNRYLKRTIEFDAPIESIGLGIGDVALIQHDMMNWGVSGRLASGSTTTTLKFDKPVQMETGNNYAALVIHDKVVRSTGTFGSYNAVDNLIVVDNLTNTSITTSSVKRLVQTSTGNDVEIIDINIVGTTAYITVATSEAPTFTTTGVELIDTDVIEERDVVFDGTETQEVTVTAAFSQAPALYSNYMFGIKEIVKRPYRLKGVNGNGFHKRTLTFMEYNDAIYNPPEHIVPYPPTSTPNVPQHVNSIKYVYDPRATDANTVVKGTLSWSSGDKLNYGGADIYVSVDEGDYIFAKTVLNVTETQLDFHFGDVVSIKVVAFNNTLVRAPIGTAPYITQSILAGGAFLDAPDTLAVTLISYLALGVVEATWNAPVDYADDPIKYRVQIKHPGQTTWDEYGVTSETILRIGDLAAGSYSLRIRTELAEAISVWVTSAFSVGTTVDTIQPGATVGAPNGTPVGSRTADQVNNELDNLNDQVANGGATLTTSITNQNISLFSYADGVVADYSRATGSFVAKQGSTDVSSNFTLSTVDNPQSLTIGYAGQTYSITGGFDTNEDAATVTIRATGSGVYAGKTFDFIINLTKIKTGYEIVSALPSTNLFDGRLVYLNTDGKLYRYVVGTGWTATVAAVDINGQLIAAQIADGVINTAKFASTIEPVTLVTSVPGTKSTNTIYNSTNGKLYRWDGSAYVASVPTTDLTGTVTTAQIADAALTASKFASSIEPVTLVTSVPGTKSTETVFNTTNKKLYRWDGSAYVSTVATTDLSGSITNSQIADLAAAKVTGQLVDSQIAAVAATKVTGQITSTQITDSSITTPKIAANSITTDKMVIAPGNLVANSNFETGDFANWRLYDNPSNSSIVVGLGSGNLVGNYCAMTWTGAARSITAFAATKAYSDTGADKDGITVRGGEQYSVSISVNKTSDYAATNFLVRAYYLKSDGTYANVVTPEPLNISVASITAGVWNTFTGAFTVPTDAIRVWLLVRSNAHTAGSVYWTRLYCARKASSELIVDGAIISDKIAANSITADKIAANSITADKLTIGIKGANLITDGSAESLSTDAWYQVESSGGGGTLSAAYEAGSVNTNRFVINKSTTGISSAYGARAVQVIPGKTYVIRARIWGFSSSSSGLFIRTQFRTTKPATGFIGPLADARDAFIDHLSNAAVSASPTFYEYSFTVPASMYWASVSIYNWAGGPTNLAFYGVELFEQATNVTIADGAITSNKVQANSITAGHIAAGNISTSHLSSNSVTTEKMAIAPGNLVPNSDFATGDFNNWRPWSNPGFQTVIVSPYAANPANYVRYGPVSGSSAISTFAFSKAYTDTGSDKDGISVVPGEEYSVSITATKSSDYAASGFFVHLYFMMSDGTLSTAYQAISLTPAGITTGSIWTRYDGSVTIPSGAKRCWPYVYSQGHSAGYVYWTQLSVTKKASANLIVDGAITASKIAASTITGDKIAGLTITAGHIAAGNISSDKLASNSVIAGKIAAGAVSAAEIAAGAITAEKIAVGVKGTNLVVDGAVESGTTTAWTYYSPTGAGGTYDAGLNNSYTQGNHISMTRNGSGGLRLASKAIRVTPGKTYVYRAKTWGSSASSAGLYLRVVFQAGAPSDGFVAPGTDLVDIVANGPITTSLATHEGVITVPAGMYWASVSPIHWSTSTATTLAVTDFEFFEQTTGVVIANGAVTAAKIAANTITASQIAASTITSTQLASNSVTSNQISAGAVTAAKISVTSLDSLTATIGTLRTATSGARTEIKDNVIKVYDSSNVLRVQLGDLSL